MCTLAPKMDQNKLRILYKPCEFFSGLTSKKSPKKQKKIISALLPLVRYLSHNICPA